MPLEYLVLKGIFFLSAKEFVLGNFREYIYSQDKDVPPLSPKSIRRRRYWLAALHAAITCTLLAELGAWGFAFKLTLLLGFIDGLYKLGSEWARDRLLGYMREDLEKEMINRVTIFTTFALHLGMVYLILTEAQKARLPILT